MNKVKMNFGQVMQLQKAKDIHATQGKVEQPPETEAKKDPVKEVAPASQETAKPSAKPDTPKGKPSVTRAARKQSVETKVSAERVETIRQLVSEYEKNQLAGLPVGDFGFLRISRPVYIKLLHLRAVCGVRLNVLMTVIVERFLKELEEGLIDKKE